MKLRQRKYFFLFLFWGWILFILANSLFPGQIEPIEQNANQGLLRVDYILHFGAYFVLAVFFFFWQVNGRYILFRKQVLLFLAGGLLLAAGSEIVQYFVPERSFNLYDFISNTLGLVLGISFPQWIFHQYKHKGPS